MAFSSNIEMTGGVAKVTLEGELDASVAGEFREAIEQAAASNPQRLVLYMDGLVFMASAGLRVLIYAKQKMGPSVDIYLIGCQQQVLNTLQMSGFHHSVYIQDTYTDS